MKNKHSFTIGEHGPVLMEDARLHETMANFISSNHLDRIIFVKGYGTFESGILQRTELPNDDNFSQAGKRYRMLGWINLQS